MELIESALEVKLQENQTENVSQFLGSYVPSYGMYIHVCTESINTVWKRYIKIRT